MNEEQLNAFKEYEELKAVIKSAEERLKELQPIILPLVPEDKELQGKDGYFYIQYRSKWKYSPETEDLADELKAQQDAEKANGLAEESKTPVLYYRTGTPNKKESE